MARTETQALIALGANRPSALGDPRETLEAALDCLRNRRITVVAAAPWMVSPAWPAGSGPDYVNGAAHLSCALRPQALLAELHEVEAELGRERSTTERWASRPCDLDLLACGAMVAPSVAVWRAMAAAPPETPRPTMIVPHPLLHTRAFALAPLARIAANWCHPVLGQSVAEMLAALPAEDRDAVILL